MFKKIFKEEILIPATIFIAVAIAFLPFIYEVISVKRHLPQDRFPLIESDFAPDTRVHLSRMQQGFEGKWLVREKYTAESHQPSILHISYLLMGKTTGLLRIAPPQAFPIWRLLCGVFMLASGYYFLLNIFSDKKMRLAAFLLFVFVGNLPILSKTGIPFLGTRFSTFLDWYTFFDPVKRVVFLPHYTLSAGFLNLAMAFLWRGRERMQRTEFLKAGFFAFLAGLVLPQTLLVIISTAVLVALIDLVLRPTKEKKMVLICASKNERSPAPDGVGRSEFIKKFIIQSLPFWLLAGLSLALIKFSLSYFPWNIQSLADLSKRSYLRDYQGVFFGLGTTGLVGFLAAFYIFLRRQKQYYLVALWLLATLFGVITFEIFPIFHPYRFIQIDLHLPLAITSVILISDLSGLFAKKSKLFFSLLTALMLLPSFLVWPVSLKAQKMFIDAKIVADTPLIPQLPYVVYPIRSVIEAIFWLKDNTDSDEVVLAAETLGSMIPAYAGNTVYLGHGDQTVNFKEKEEQMKRFYKGEMTPDETKAFLKQNKVQYIFFGPEEKEIDSGFLKFENALFKEVFIKDKTVIYKVI